MKDKHTPGPWTATGFGSIEYKDGILGEAYDFNPGFDAMEGEKLPWEANARLIAAAPELLKALKAVIYAYSVHEFPVLVEARESAKKLIAKIEGDEE